MPTKQTDGTSSETPLYTEGQLHLAGLVLRDIDAGMDVFKAIRQHPLPDGAGFLSKHALITAYRNQIQDGTRQENRDLFQKIRLKPMRTLSGVTTVTVLTKPSLARVNVFSVLIMKKCR